MPGLTLDLIRCRSNNGAVARQAIPCDAEIAVEGLLAFLGVTGLADPMCLPTLSGQQNGRIAMTLQGLCGDFPLAMVQDFTLTKSSKRVE